MLVAGAELGFRIMLDEPGTWQPDDLAEFLSRTATRGMLASASAPA